MTAPSTHLGWAPPWTNTPEEIARRRRDAVAEVEDHRFRASADRRAWDAVIAEFQAENGAGESGGVA